MDLRRAYRLLRHDWSDSNLAGIQEFLERGGYPNYEIYSGMTIFHEAISFPLNNIEVFRLLINAGADVNTCSHLGLTPLFHAVLYRKRFVVEALIQSGASVNAKDFLGRTVLHHAVCRWVLQLPFRMIRIDPDIWLINKLLKHKDIDCNVRDIEGNTPLMMAIIDRQIDAVKLLLGNNANPNICNNFSQTPLHMKFYQPPNYTESLLLYSGASIYSVDKKGQTPLDILIKNGLGSRCNDWVKRILKIIAKKYSVTSDVKRKFDPIPQLSEFFNQCCVEIDHMRGDLVFGNITMHDLLLNCFNEHDFEIIFEQMYKPVVKRLVRGIYIKYLKDILYLIPKKSLFSILQTSARMKKRSKTDGEFKDLADLFSIKDIIDLFSKYISDVEIIYLIGLFSDVVNSEFA